VEMYVIEIRFIESALFSSSFLSLNQSA